MNNDYMYTCSHCHKRIPLEQIKGHTQHCLYLEAIKRDVNSAEYHPYGAK